MENNSKKFLEQLIECYSPSGYEYELQKIWKDYVTPYAHEVNIDAAGNVIACINPKADFKVLLTGHCDEIAFMVNYIDEQGYIYVTKAGGISPKVALGMKVKILGKNSIINGVVGVQAEHHGGAKNEIKLEDIFIDCGLNDKEKLQEEISIGDYIIYDTSYKYLLNNTITGRGLDDRTGAFIIAEVMKNIADKNVKVGVYGVSTVNEETNMGGAYFAASRIKPSIGIACDVTFATDYPGVNLKKVGDVKLGKGPVLAKGAPINTCINRLLEKVACENKIPVQYELTPGMTGTDADKIRLSGQGVPVALVSLPLRYMHSPVEIVSLDDIDKEIDLLTNFILNLVGDEELRPF